MDLPTAVIVDIDGTLALRNDRDPYDFEKCRDDTVNEAVHFLLECAHPETVIVLVSGREDKWRSHTIEWLTWHGITYDALLMRKTGDGREDSIIKREIYEAEIEKRFRVIFVVDDRLRTCRMWHSIGLPLFRFGDPEADY
jgi:hypothetical protein